MVVEDTNSIIRFACLSHAMSLHDALQTLEAQVLAEPTINKSMGKKGGEYEG